MASSPSGTPAAGPHEILAFQRRAWEQRPLLRELYRAWFRRVEGALSRVGGATVEVGCGIGTFKEFMPEAIATDVIATEWTDRTVDAEHLPYEDASLANLVMIDVLHHLPKPERALDEASRALRPGGRLVALEPYCSLVSTPAWRGFHHEPIDMRADPFDARAKSTIDPFDSNSALPTLMFWRHEDELRRRWPQLQVVSRERFACLVYPLSGGFSGRQLCGEGIGKALMSLDDRLSPLAWALGFRCLVAVERRHA